MEELSDLFNRNVTNILESQWDFTAIHPGKPRVGIVKPGGKSQQGYKTDCDEI